MTFLFRVLVVCSGLILGGCTQINSSSLRDMSAAYRSVLEEYSNDNVLLNIVRASHRMPVSFLDMPSIMGSGSVMNTVGLGASVASANPGSVGGLLSALSVPGTSSFQPNLSLSVNTGFNFTQSSLDNAAFMKSFLSSVTPDTVSSLTNNSVAPPEVLYSLITDSIEIRNDKNEVVLLTNNNPMADDYESNFQKVLQTLVASGLTTEPSIVKQVLSPPMTAGQVSSQFGVLTNAFTQPGFMLEVIKKAGYPDMYQAVKMAPMTKFCFNRQLTGAVLGHIFSEAAYCSAVGTYKGISAVNLDGAIKGGNVTLVMHLRSTRTVFDYLGLLVAMQQLPTPKMVTIQSVWNASKGGVNQNNPAFPLFVVNKNGNNSDALSSVTYDGARYSIPRNSESWTKDVLVTVGQLLSLNKVAGAIPASPAVLIK